MRPKPVKALLVLSSVVGLALSALIAVPVQAAPKIDAIAIGDSVMLGAKYELQRRGFNVVDAAVSRQAATGPGLLRKQGAKLPRNVVVHLGSNGTYSKAMCRELVRTAGPQRRVFLVTIKVPRTYEGTNNVMLRKCASGFGPERVRIVDWNWAATKNPQWLYADGIHLRPQGARAFARIMRNAINSANASEQFASSTPPRPSM
jgi:lysophospholipase L1-like esterase